MVKRFVLAVSFVLLLFALACLYVGGVASFSNWIAHRLQPGPRLVPASTIGGDNWVLFAETEHFHYYVRAGDHIPWWAMELAEDYLDAASRALRISPPLVIRYYKHPSQRDLYEITGSRSTGIVLPAKDGHGPELHSVRSYDPHEVMHILIHEAMGEPPALFDEGLATAFGWDWSPGERSVHTRACLLLEQGRLVPLKSILTNWDFRSYKSYPAYITAGSFMSYLLTTYGASKLSKLLELDKYSQQNEIEECFASVYGVSIYDVEAQWHKALQQGTLPVTSRNLATKDSHTSIVITAVVLLTAALLGGVLFIIIGEKLIDSVVRGIRLLIQALGAILAPSKRK